MKKIIVLLTVAIIPLMVSAAGYTDPDPELLGRQWDARWITHPGHSPYDYGVLRFRKSFVLDDVPGRFVVNVSADQRYELFVNGEIVSRGPARGSRYKWFFETVDIAQHLVAGENIVAAVVWNYGEWSPGAQESLYTAFILQGNGKVEDELNTGADWKVYHDVSYSPSLSYLIDVGPGDIIDGHLFPWGWDTAGFDDSAWVVPSVKEPGQPFGTGTQYLRPLVARTIPAMEEYRDAGISVREVRGDGVPGIGSFPIMVPAGCKVSVLLDRGQLTNAYPLLTVSGGDGAEIRVTYAESLFYPDGSKGNRNEVEGKTITGYIDIFLPDGRQGALYRPLWFRTYRYVMVEVEAGEESVTLDSFDAVFTGYPFEEKGYFGSDDGRLGLLWDTGWLTARLCAGENYFDCPYYEQLQYTGDTRIQGLISLYVAGDDRLLRKAIDDIGNTITPEGILHSRAPARYAQVIPPFSLYWVNMLHDYYMHIPDGKFVLERFGTVERIIDWFVARIDPVTGMLGPLPDWNFTDWPDEWPWSDREPTGGTPPGAREGGSAILTLQLAYTLEDAVRLASSAGKEDLARRYDALRDGLNRIVYERCFDIERGLFKDDIAGTSYSQHASVMGILSGAVPEYMREEVYRNLMADRSLIQATLYYRFYLFMAMKKAGLANEYTDNLDVWYNMLDNGLTTFAERPEPTRSDCHAWSASPCYDLLATVCGVTPSGPGFASVSVEPAPGRLEKIEGRVPHPAGFICVNLEKSGRNLKGTVELPAGVKGTYRWEGNEKELAPGGNIIGF